MRCGEETLLRHEVNPRVWIEASGVKGHQGDDPS